MRGALTSPSPPIAAPKRTLRWRDPDGREDACPFSAGGQSVHSRRIPCRKSQPSLAPLWQCTLLSDCLNIGIVPRRVVQQQAVANRFAPSGIPQSEPTAKDRTRGVRRWSCREAGASEAGADAGAGRVPAGAGRRGAAAGAPAPQGARATGLRRAHAARRRAGDPDGRARHDGRLPGATQGAVPEPCHVRRRAPLHETTRRSRRHLKTSPHGTMARVAHCHVVARVMGRVSHRPVVSIRIMGQIQGSPSARGKSLTTLVTRGPAGRQIPLNERPPFPESAARPRGAAEEPLAGTLHGVPGGRRERILRARRIVIVRDSLVCSLSLGHSECQEGFRRGLGWMKVWMFYKTSRIEKDSDDVCLATSI